MKNQLVRVSLVTLAVLVAMLTISVSVFAARGNPGKGNANQTQVAPLTGEEIAGLVFMREEEKLARDIYLELNDLWNVPVFSNIAASEQRHADAVEKLLDKYGIDDPVADESVRGNFTDPGLQSLYGDLLDQGSQSLEDAFAVGVLIEETDIADLQEALAAPDLPSDIERVYTNLLNGSNNHLAAFTSQID